MTCSYRAVVRRTKFAPAFAPAHLNDENVVRVLKKEFVHAIPGSAALDLGSGSGRHLPLLAEHFSRTIACVR